MIVGSALAGMLTVAESIGAQAVAPPLRTIWARSAGPTTPINIYNLGNHGSVQVVGWSHDSVHFAANGATRDIFFGGNPSAMKMGAGDFYHGGNKEGMKVGLNERGVRDTTAYRLVVHVPKRSQVVVRTASADITSSDVSGRFYSASGTIQLSGSTNTLEVESINGSIVIDASASWVRARTGEGRLLIRGAVQDIDASTVGGMLDVATPTVLRGRFASVTGDIRYAGAPARGSLFEFSNHGGAVDFVLPRTVSSVFELSSVTGPIENGFTQVLPAAAGPHSMRLNLGRGGAQVTVRTFKGPIRLRPQ
jgi:hypothetical protein